MWALKGNTDITDENYALYNATALHPERLLPYILWFPVDDTETPYHELIFFFQVFVGIAHGFYIGAADAFICGFMMHFKAQFLIIRNTLQRMLQRAEQSVVEELGKLDVDNEETKIVIKGITYDVSVLTPRTQMYVEKFIKECAIHHQELMTFCLEAENVCCYLMLVQFISSLLIICFQLFYLSLTPPASPQYLSMTCYFILMMFQILTYCWHGNEVQIVSGELLAYLYNDIDWLVTNETTRRSLILMMMRSQRPFCFTAGKFALLSLQTYMSIIRGSASYFIFLSKMNTES